MIFALRVKGCSGAGQGVSILGYGDRRRLLLTLGRRRGQYSDDVINCSSSRLNCLLGGTGVPCVRACRKG